MEQTHNYAGFWRRFLALSVDLIIEVLLIWGLAFSLGVNPFTEIKTNLETVYQVISFFITAAFSIIFWISYDGATPGKKLLAIKIVHGENAKPITFGVAIIRYIGYLISFVPLGIGYFWVAFDSKKQGWHDKIAGTYVVKTDKKPRIGLAIFLTILGIIGFIATATISGISQSPKVQEAVKESLKESDSNYKSFQPQQGDADNILSYAPSNCSLSIPVPKTEDTQDGKQRKWVYEELEAEKGAEAINFYVLDSDTYAFVNSKVLLSNISYKNPQQLLGKNEESFVFPGLNVWCADNYKNLSLEEFKSLALLNKKLNVKEAGSFKWGELDVIGVNLQGSLPDGFKLNEPGYIAVTKDGKKLLYMRQWAPSLQDSIHDKLTTDLNVIIHNLRFR